jgi:hypothetical protein
MGSVMAQQIAPDVAELASKRTANQYRNVHEMRPGRRASTNSAHCWLHHERFRLVLFSMALAIFWTGIKGSDVDCIFIFRWDTIQHSLCHREVVEGEGCYC